MLVVVCVCILLYIRMQKLKVYGLIHSRQAKRPAANVIFILEFELGNPRRGSCKRICSSVYLN